MDLHQRQRLLGRVDYQEVQGSPFYVRVLRDAARVHDPHFVEMEIQVLRVDVHALNPFVDQVQWIPVMIERQEGRPLMHRQVRLSDDRCSSSVLKLVLAEWQQTVPGEVRGWTMNVEKARVD